MLRTSFFSSFGCNHARSVRLHHVRVSGSIRLQNCRQATSIGNRCGRNRNRLSNRQLDARGDGPRPGRDRNTSDEDNEALSATNVRGEQLKRDIYIDIYIGGNAKQSSTERRTISSRLLFRLYTSTSFRNVRWCQLSLQDSK